MRDIYAARGARAGATGPLGPDTLDHAQQRSRRTTMPRTADSTAHRSFRRPCVSSSARLLVGTGAADAAEMALDTFRAMARGGIYDQVGGGFHRYAVDDAWQVPHFEKMLYDNALLIGLGTHLWQATQDAEVRTCDGGDAGLGAPRNDGRRRRLLRIARRGQRRRRRQVLRLGRIRARHRPRPRFRRLQGVLWRHSWRELRGIQHPARGRRSRGRDTPRRDHAGCAERGARPRTASRSSPSAIDGRDLAATRKNSPRGTASCSAR